MRADKTWNRHAIGDLAGQTALVTGASSGIGFETARGLAAHGARVLLACRDLDRGRRAAQRMTSAAPRSSVDVEVLDLADLASVRRFADRVVGGYAGLDVLVNNAGIAGGPRRRTADGFEAHFGTNHLGHFALTGLLLPALRSRPGARVVTLASSVAAQGKINFADLNSERSYRFTSAYSQSKLASLMFAIELDRRAKAAGLPLTSIAVDPGIVATSLLRSKRDQWGSGPGLAELAVAAAQRLLGQSPAEGCATSLYAATARGLHGGEYVVPGDWGHKRGAPALARLPRQAQDQETARQLWEVSADLTGVDFSFAG